MVPNVGPHHHIPAMPAPQAQGPIFRGWPMLWTVDLKVLKVLCVPGVFTENLNWGYLRGCSTRLGDQALGP